MDKPQVLILLIDYSSEFGWLSLIITFSNAMQQGRPKGKAPKPFLLGPPKNKVFAINICILSICTIKGHNSVVTLYTAMREVLWLILHSRRRCQIFFSFILLSLTYILIVINHCNTRNEKSIYYTFRNKKISLTHLIFLILNKKTPFFGPINQ